ncbi:hypothetical protein J7354_01545 [Sulfitobacter sp. R18_2]|uniref:hypothetical protein n=1 Tax=Sulfitobacter sp. R18_2 TaxID=2821105 RepID=UPI001ADAE828|nr:hypothetical protein [Sulfitobacter sp. R18_2]MBO9437334.1 hypothetical protein [Sulfitobacter sp. R18_2]
MTVNLKVSGFRQIEKALAQLPRGTSKGVARRAMKKELKPVLDMAEAFWPGSGDAFRITSAIKSSQRADSYAERGPSVTNMFVGSFEPQAHLLEFGTGPRYQKSGKYVGSINPTPMLQPAWDANKHKMLEGLGARLWDEIEKTVARRAKRAAK